MKANYIKCYLIAASAITLGVPGLARAGGGGSFAGWHNASGYGGHVAHWSYNNGTFERSATTQFAGGRKVNTSSSTQWTSSGRTTTASYNTSDGKSGTYTGSVTNSTSDRMHQQQLTTQSGATYSRNVNTSYGDGSVTRTINRTNPSGESSGRTVTIGN
jgi:hypothetical protein